MKVIKVGPNMQCVFFLRITIFVTLNKIMLQSNSRKIYFASDQHFGAPTAELSFPREQKFVRWLDEVKQDAEAIFLLGDLFDFWFEYKTVVPKGFVRVLGKLTEIRDSGIPIYFFVGNHDLWMADYFDKELNIPTYHDNKEFTFGNKTFLIGHGDGKGPGDKGYKRMKKVFTAPFSKWLYRWLHPDIGMKLAQYLSVKNKLISGKCFTPYLIYFAYIISHKYFFINILFDIQKISSRNAISAKIALTKVSCRIVYRPAIRKPVYLAIWTIPTARFPNW